jgi:cell division protein FtsB
MVTHRRRRSILTAFALYILAAAFIGYFAVNAFTGNLGLHAQQDLEQQMTSIKDELDALKAERAEWEQRVSLMRPDRIDPDMLEERGRALLDYVDPRDVTLLLKPR